jgi:hypothetical protein
LPRPIAAEVVRFRVNAKRTNEKTVTDLTHFDACPGDLVQSGVDMLFVVHDERFFILSITVSDIVKSSVVISVTW